MKRHPSYRTRRAIIDQLNVNTFHEITKFQRSSVIGLWRMGNTDNLIAIVNNMEWKDVRTIIKTYKSINHVE